MLLTYFYSNGMYVIILNYMACYLEPHKNRILSKTKNPKTTSQLNPIETGSGFFVIQLKLYVTCIN